MIETGTGDAAYYADITQAVLTLAVTAPGGPPADGAEFLDRLDPAWLAAAYAGDPGPLAAARAARAQLPDIALRYRTLLSRLGPALDGPGTLAEADAWYFILEGTREQSVAEAQAMALTELTAALATSPGTEPRAILLACDDYSAVSGRVPLVAALRTRPVPGDRGAGLRPVLAGTRRELRTSGTGSPPPPTAGSGCCAPPTRSRSASWPAPTASSRPRPRSSAACGATKDPPASSTPGRSTRRSPARPRPGRPPTSTAGAATWVQVARPQPSPLPLPPPSARPAPAVVIPAPVPQQEPPPPPAAPAALEDAFGQEARR